MTRSNSSRIPSASARRPNLMVVVIATVATGILYVNFDPPSAGARGSHAEALAPLAPAVPLIASTSSGGEGSRSSAAELQDAKVVYGRPALLLHLLLLEKGIEKLAKVPSYGATLYKQERVDNVLAEGQTVEMKVRHEPFSVYMKWLTGDKGREVLYVEGQNDGNMIVHAGGWKARLLPALNLNPEGAIAMRESRHPITMAGLLAAARKMTEYRRTDLDVEDLPIHCALHFCEKFNDRPCYCCVIEYEQPEDFQLYRKSIVHIDEELCLPVCIRNYAWPVGEATELEGEALDEETLMEYYAYTDIRIDERLAEVDFDQANEEYRFRR